MTEPQLASRIISVCNLKGGAGKSTIAVNLACAIRAFSGLHCILVDADRQATALAWADNGDLGIRVTSRVLHEARRDDPHPGLAWVKQIRLLAQRNPAVIIDLPPGLDYALAAVAAISDLIFVPVIPSGIDIHSTSRFIKVVQKAREIRDGEKPRCVIVPNRFDRRTVPARIMALYDRFGEPVASPIGMRAAFVQAFDRGRWVGAISPRSEARKEIEQLVSFVIADAAGPPASVGDGDDEGREQPQNDEVGGAAVIVYRAAGMGDHPAAGLGDEAEPAAPANSHARDAGAPPADDEAARG